MGVYQAMFDTQKEKDKDSNKFFKNFIRKNIIFSIN